MMVKRKIIIDCDPGIDDALVIALALHSPQLEILGITTVAGNKELEKTSANAIRTLEYFGRTDIAVYVGAGKPLVRDLNVPQESSHGKDGLGDAGLPGPERQAKPNALGFMKDALKKYPGEVTILATGPLTNIALLLQDVDSSAIRELFIMNGAFKVRGNVTEFAEYNAFIDPEAARIVYSSGIPTKVVGLDVTNNVAVTREEFVMMKQIDTPQAHFFTMTHDWATTRKQKERYAIFWDPLALMWMLVPTMIHGQMGKIEVEAVGEKTGQTTFSSGPGSVYVGETVNAAQFFDHLHKFLKFGEVV